MSGQLFQINFPTVAPRCLKEAAAGKWESQYLMLRGLPLYITILKNTNLTMKKVKLFQINFRRVAPDPRCLKDAAEAGKVKVKGTRTISDDSLALLLFITILNTVAKSVFAAGNQFFEAEFS